MSRLQAQTIASTGSTGYVTPGRPTAIRCGGSSTSTRRAEQIGRIDTAAAGPGAPVPPGMHRLPGPGEFVASPALRDLLASTPDAQLADRFPGRLVGMIGDAGTARARFPHRGRRATRRRSSRSATVPSGPPRPPDIAPRDCPSGCYAGIPANGLLLSSPSSRLAADLPAARPRRLGHPARGGPARAAVRGHAAGRCHPAPGRDRLGVEATVSPLAGTAAGFGIFYLVRPAGRDPVQRFARCSRPTCHRAGGVCSGGRWRARGVRAGGEVRAETRTDIAFRRHPAGHAQAAAGVAADPARPRPRRAGVLHRPTAGDVERSGARLPPGHPVRDDRPGDRRAVADHGRGPAARLAGPPPGQP